MINPAIQNDFSYYRRSLSRMKIAKKDADIKVRDDLANRMSLFYAYPTPMMNMICDTTSKVLTTNMALPLENVTKALACYANICADMVEKRRFYYYMDLEVIFAGLQTKKPQCFAFV